jgi:hypothetical protein
MYSTYLPWAPHTYDFVVLTSLIHPRKIILVALQIGKWEIGKAKDLSAPLRIIPSVLLSNEIWRWLNSTLKECLWHIRRNIFTLVWRDWRKLRKTSVGIAGFWKSDTSRIHVRCAELLGFFTFFFVRILGTREHDVAESGSVSVFRWGGKTFTQLGPLDRANLNHSFRNVVFSCSLNTGWWKSPNPSISECDTPSSEPFRIYTSDVLFLGYLTTISAARVNRVELMDDRWMIHEKDLEESCCGLI